MKKILFLLIFISLHASTFETKYKKLEKQWEKDHNTLGLLQNAIDTFLKYPGDKPIDFNLITAVVRANATVVSLQQKLTFLNQILSKPYINNNVDMIRDINAFLNFIASEVNDSQLLPKFYELFKKLESNVSSKMMTQFIPDETGNLKTKVEHTVSVLKNKIKSDPAKTKIFDEILGWLNSSNNIVSLATSLTHLYQTK